MRSTDFVVFVKGVVVVHWSVGPTTL